ncbi:YqaA family protein [Psychrobium sp. 1_MG-2023]|uniref:YqaA family protein n=1 Tax=Psychrobium sp. 1_MG-2023 TaxID=3062624 RepID=UPI000C34AF3C|nr:YqaA family protein [Psychrobium sp. 1_MG-2023]MDP2562395.1 YqaA family protein [Psychrobium sp. 1_MG-2023]PKF55840.1 hypothetical protein CW748_11935 [Alteromonadales bacterium alter-6D02]
MLLGLFISCFLAATLLPGGSEALLLYLVEQHPTQVTAMLIVASVGNSLGSLTSYGLGYLGRVKVNPEQLDSKAARLVERYGVYSLIFSWLPLVGDLLCVLAGYFKYRFIPSLILISLGKTLRYTILVWGYIKFIQ